MKSLLITTLLLFSSVSFAGNTGGGTPYKPIHDGDHSTLEASLGNTGGGLKPASSPDSIYTIGQGNTGGGGMP